MKKDKRTDEEIVRDIVTDYTMGAFPNKKEESEENTVSKESTLWDTETPEQKAARQAEEPGWWNV